MLLGSWPLRGTPLGAAEEMSCGSLFPSDHGSAEAMSLARSDPNLGVLHPRATEQALSHWREISAFCGGNRGIPGQVEMVLLLFRFVIPYAMSFAR